MKHVNVEQLVKDALDVPDLKTRKGKLTHAANILRKLPPEGVLFLWHNLEHCKQEDLDRLPAAVRSDSDSFFTHMLNDEFLRAAGVGDTIGKQQRFFELSIPELHEFSCDCGGAISNRTMADRVTRLAGGNPAQLQQSRMSPIQRFKAWFA